MKLEIKRRNDKAVIAVGTWLLPEEITFVKAGCCNPNYAALLSDHLNEQYAAKLRNEFIRGNHFASTFKREVLEVLTYYPDKIHPNKLLKAVCDRLKKADEFQQMYWQDTGKMRGRIRQLMKQLRDNGIEPERAKRKKAENE